MMSLVLSDFNSLAVLLTRHSARSRNIGLQLQSKFVRRRRHHQHHHPRVSADYDSSGRERREREREREPRATGGRAGRRWMRPPDQCSGGSGHDARRSRRGASRRWRAGSPRDAKRGCAKRSPLPVYTRAESQHALRPSRVPLCASWCPLRRVPGSSPGSETPTYDRWTLRVWADSMREKEEAEGAAGAEGEIESEACISENWRYPGTIRTCDSPAGASCFYFNRNLGNVCRGV